MAGVTLFVTAGGIIYYLNESRGDAPAKGTTSAADKKKTKRGKRKGKKDSEKETPKASAEEPKIGTLFLPCQGPVLISGRSKTADSDGYH